MLPMDDASFTTRIGIHSGVHATRCLMAVALPDSGSPQTFITAGCWQHMVNAGAADDHCISTVSPLVFDGFGSSSFATVDQSVRLSVQFFHDTGPTARLAVWALLVPDGSMLVDVFWVVIAGYVFPHIHARRTHLFRADHYQAD